MRKISRSTKDTIEIARMFLRGILTDKKPTRARVVGLSGNLGAGKTAFVKAVAKILGVRSTVNSPTFVIIKKHLIRKKGPHKFLFHIDAYRLNKEEELVALGWREILKDPRNLIFIEWPENIQKVVPRGAKKISIFHHPNGHRRFEI